MKQYLKMMIAVILARISCGAALAEEAVPEILHGYPVVRIG